MIYLMLATILAAAFPFSPGFSACIQPTAAQTRGSGTECWSQASTQLAMNECAADDLKHIDAELNTTYREVISKYSNDPGRITRIKKAETAWLAFRDSEVDVLFPESSRKERGSVFSMCRAMHLTRLTEERIKALRAMLQHEEGDVCAP
jgi:uncharacterized protein YecT (DUF1311 family)